MYRTQEIVAAEIVKAHAQATRAEKRLRQSVQGLKNALITVEKNLEGLQNTRNIGGVFVLRLSALRSRGRHPDARSGLLATSTPRSPIPTGAQFRLYRAIGQPNQSLIRRVNGRRLAAVRRTAVSPKCPRRFYEPPLNGDIPAAMATEPQHVENVGLFIGFSAPSGSANALSSEVPTMNPIEFALRHPIAVIVGMVALLGGGGLAVSRMKIDIFPALNLPVVYVCQPYGGMDPQQMEGLIANYYEYHFLYINGIHHVESKNVQGISLMKLFFHPGTDMAQAMAETVGYVNRSRAFMPPGTVPPFIMRFDTGSVPVGYLVLKSETKTVGQIQDEALFKVRPMFASIPGVSAPPPFGGNQRTIVVYLRRRPRTACSSTTCFIR